MTDIIHIAIFVLALIYLVYVFMNKQKKIRNLIELIIWLLIVVAFGSTSIDLLKTQTYFAFACLLMLISRAIVMIRK